MPCCREQWKCIQNETELFSFGLFLKKKYEKKNIPNYSKSEAYIFLLSYFTLNVRLSSCSCLWCKCNREMYKLFFFSSYIFILDAFHAFDVLSTQCTKFPASCDTNLICLQIRRIEFGKQVLRSSWKRTEYTISSTSAFSRCPKFKSNRWAWSIIAARKIGSRIMWFVRVAADEEPKCDKLY